MMQTEPVHTFDETLGRVYPIQWMQIGHLHDVPVPLVRVSTCGGLQLEVLQEVINTDPPLGRYQIVTLEHRPKGSSTGLTLLKVLTSLPEHYALKDWLLENVPRTRGSEDEDEEGWGKGLVRIDNVVCLLRGLLCPKGITGGDTLRKKLVIYIKNHRDSGPSYRLASGPLLWLDVDVIATSIKQAVLLEQQGKEALSCWEQAHAALASKGTYLPDECYSDWAIERHMSVENVRKKGYQMMSKADTYHSVCLDRFSGYARE
ncbi:hypothetical protein ccbrp13_20550 [Ktedonobacteria bacterium brp13]|nr:hypothetical protein ccbrp13_20550 [Ktedonobacteria bacterium brp13]